MPVTLEVFGTTFTNVKGFKATDDNDNTVVVDIGGGSPNLQSKTKSYTPTETAQTETVSPDTGYDGLSSVEVSVGAISSSYVGSGVSRRSSSDLTASGATVTVPAGYYSAQATKSVSSGSATTPATTVTANPSISVNSSTGLITATASASQSVTPAVSAGYVASGTAGTITVSGSNTSQLSTQTAQTIHPSTTDQTISSGKYLTGTQTIKAVTHNLTAGIIKAGEVVKIGDSTDDDCVASVTGTYAGGSSKNVQVAQSTTRVASTSYTKTASLTCSTTGTYDVYWDCFRSSTSGTNGSQLYIGGSSYGTANTTFANSIHTQTNHLTGVSINADQEVAVYVRSRATNYYAYCGQLTIVQTG